ncbi:MAG: sulfotransferase domain-containing protein [Moorea sp. SIO4E2]|uniref:sulfotransferase domain-containing protein n=1 Tax=Moorena sp. SIO4E2 TaxID=2607826 RepID=UPI0013BAAC23|nr:sulfotransferase domain-containing protein [Moorena sp. SIO4E2]NEQ11468.1 sulfotransferase domain-containing protein [Moorena sp. SIO4E2]
MSYTKVKLGRVLINSLPKSGTHLLAKAIEIFGYQEHFTNGDNLKDDSDLETPIFFNYREVKKALQKEKSSQKTEAPNKQISVGALTPLYVDKSVFRHWLEVMSEGRYILGHIPQTPVLSEVLADLDYHHVFIIREPRSVVASSLPFILDTGKMPAKHFLENDFKQMSVEQRLDFILEGGYAPQAGVEIKSFAEVYRSMLAWRNEQNCLFLRFEDLVGEKGGGSLEQQIKVIKSIASHLGFPFDENIAAKSKEIYNPSSRTFRTGKIDGWKSSLDGKLVERLVEYCEPLCKEAGY